jgi:hypothetical protein
MKLLVTLVLVSLALLASGLLPTRTAIGAEPHPAGISRVLDPIATENAVLADDETPPPDYSLLWMRDLEAATAVAAERERPLMIVFR